MSERPIHVDRIFFGGTVTVGIGALLIFIGAFLKAMSAAGLLTVPIITKILLIVSTFTLISYIVGTILE